MYKNGPPPACIPPLTYSSNEETPLLGVHVRHGIWEGKIEADGRQMWRCEDLGMAEREMEREREEEEGLDLRFVEYGDESYTW